MKRPTLGSALFSSLILVSAIGLAACSSPSGPGADGSTHWDMTDYAGQALNVDISATGALTLKLSSINATTLAVVDKADVVGQCKAADAATGIITCSVTSSTGPAFIASDATLRFVEVPGTLVYLKVEPAAMASTPETQLLGASAFYLTGTTCASMDGDYSYLYTNYRSFGVHRFLLSANEYRTLDFRMNTSGTTFVSDYATDLGAGNGIHDLVSNQCVDGIRLLKINDSGWVPTIANFATESGLVLNGTDVMVPVSSQVGLSGIAGKSFKGIQFTNSGNAVPVSFAFGAEASDSSVSVTSFAASSGSAPDYSFSGMKFLAASGSAAGARFSGAVSPINALSSTYATAASIPNLMYSLATVAGGEQPTLALAWTTSSGSTGILLMNTQRDNVSAVEAGYTITTAIAD